MAGGAIKGITISFRGDTTSLDRALKDVKNEAKSTSNELKYIDKAIQFNPTSVDAWRQKHIVLNKAIEETKEKLSLMKQGLAEMESQGLSAENSEEFRRMQREIDQTERQLKSLQGELKSIGNINLRAASEQFKQWGTELESAGQKMQGVSLAAAGLVASLGTVAVKAGVAADDLNTLSKVTGIGTEELQKYSYAADLVDVSTETIAKAQQKLKKNLYEVGVYAQGPAEEFESLGVAVTNADGTLRDSEEVFNDVIKALGEVTNETERDAIAQKLMGKSAAELNPLIEDGGQTYQRVAEIMKKYNLDYVDQETLDAANKFNDEIDTLKLLGSVAFAQVGSKLAENLAPALEKVVDLVGKFAEWLGNLDPEVLTVIGTIAGFVAIIAPLLIGLGKMAFAISSIINVVGLMGGAIGAVSAGPLLLIVGAIAAVIAIGVTLYKHWDDIKKAVQTLGESIKKAWEGIKLAIVQKVAAIKHSITQTWNNIKTATSNAWNSIKEAITRPIQAAKDKIKSIIDAIKRWFPIDMSDFFGDIPTPHFSIDGEFSLDPLSVPSISVDWYAKGGIFDNPTLIGIGEAGPEAVVPLTKLWDKLDKMAENTGGPVINVYATPGMDMNQLAEKIEQILVRQERQRRMAYGI